MVLMDSWKISAILLLKHKKGMQRVHLIPWCLVKKLGNPPIWHSFLEGNKVAHFLAREGSKKSPLHQPVFLLNAPPWISTQPYNKIKKATILGKKLSLLVCNSPSKPGNLSIIKSNVIASSSYDAIASSTANYGVTATHRKKVIEPWISCSRSCLNFYFCLFRCM